MPQEEEYRNQRCEFDARNIVDFRPSKDKVPYSFRWRRPISDNSLQPQAAVIHQVISDAAAAVGGTLIHSPFPFLGFPRAEDGAPGNLGFTQLRVPGQLGYSVSIE